MMETFRRIQATRPQSKDPNPNRGIRQISPALAAELGGCCVSISTRFDSITLTIISPNSEFPSSIKVGNVEAI